jgi:hypothetical protein
VRVNSTQACVNPTQVYVNPTQACVNPTQACVNPTQVYVNPTQACVNPTQVYVNPTQACVNPTQVYVNPTQVYVNPTQVYVNPGASDSTALAWRVRCSGTCRPASWCALTAGCSLGIDTGSCINYEEPVQACMRTASSAK